MPNDHGPSVKNDNQYEGLRKKGMSKAWAAKIANTPGASKKGGKKSSWLRWTASTIDAAVRPASALSEPRAVHLVAGLLGRQAAICVYDRGAVVDHAVDLPRNWHVQPVLVGELHDHAGRLDPLGDLIHRRDDLVDALACAELLADVTVAAALTRAGDDQITHSRQAREGVAMPAHRLAELGHLAHRSSDHHGSGVLADAE